MMPHGKLTIGKLSKRNLFPSENIDADRGGLDALPETPKNPAQILLG
jgi:hypothetical protein